MEADSEFEPCRVAYNGEIVFNLKNVKLWRQRSLQESSWMFWRIWY